MTDSWDDDLSALLAQQVGRTPLPDDPLPGGPRSDRPGPDEALLEDVVSDEALLGALREALAAREAVPPAFAAVAKNAYAWHGIDAELAELTYDSGLEPALAADVRSESAAIRALTFYAPIARLSIELEVTDDVVLGQLIPPVQATVEMHAPNGPMVPLPADENGSFVIDRKPGSSFRLRCRTGPQTDVVTGWVTL